MKTIKYGFISLLCMFLLFTSAGCSSEIKENHIYDKSKIVDQMNGLGTKKVGTITVVEARSSECSDEAIVDWYLNYVKKNLDSHCHFIVYTDEKNKGIYATESLIVKDVELLAENDGTYSLGDYAGSTYYVVDESSNTLVTQWTMADASVIDNVKTKIDELIPNEYKNSDLYYIDVGGMQGSLECDINLVYKNFEKADIQSIAVNLAKNIKDLELGIGYFCIWFQCNDFDLVAVSSINDLNNQSASEMTTVNY